MDPTPSNVIYAASPQLQKGYAWFLKQTNNLYKFLSAQKATIPKSTHDLWQCSKKK